MTRVGQDLEQVRDYYTTPRLGEQESGSIYDIWEAGRAFKDSITPSTHVPEYRSHIVLKIVTITREAARILSIGCGNGFVEADLVEYGRRVTAIDCNAEAVELTRNKGVDAYVADFFRLRPDDVHDTDVVYADGVLGHLFDREDGVGPALDKMRGLRLRPGAHVVLSNDSPRDPKIAFAPHERVADFWFLSRAYLAERLTAHGFDPVESYYFPYRRPLSGLRNRTICVARVR
jgi:SAM-dependent methyltransferase